MIKRIDEKMRISVGWSDNQPLVESNHKTAVDKDSGDYNDSFCMRRFEDPSRPLLKLIAKKKLGTMRIFSMCAHRFWNESSKLPKARGYFSRKKLTPMMATASSEHRISCEEHTKLRSLAERRR